MKQLAQLQLAFQDYVLQPGNADPISWVSPDGRSDPETQLSAYAFAYRARLREVLANDYPALLTAIGDERFNQLAEDYIDAHPSRYFSLRDFGRHMPGLVFKLVQHHRHYQDKHWLHELALFEWSLGQAFDAPDRATFDEHDLASVPAESWPELRIDIHPSAQRIDFEWNVPRMWKALTQDTPSQVTAIRGIAAPWLVWRHKLTTRFRCLEADEQLALDRLIAGSSFGEACEALSASISADVVPLRAAGLLKNWIAQRLISGIRT